MIRETLDSTSGQKGDKRKEKGNAHMLFDLLRSFSISPTNNLGSDFTGP